MAETNSEKTSAPINCPKKVWNWSLVAGIPIVGLLLGGLGTYFGLKSYAVDSSNDYKIYLHVKSPDFCYFTIFYKLKVFNP